MNLEIMQLKMNNIADKLQELSAKQVLKSHTENRSHEYRKELRLSSDIYEDIANIIREEMQITHY